MQLSRIVGYMSTSIAEFIGSAIKTEWFDLDYIIEWIEIANVAEGN